MTDPDIPKSPPPGLERILSEVYLRIRQERFAEAEERLAAAKALSPDDLDVLEMEGDLAFARKRYRQAEQLYRQAHERDPKNAKLEEKFATAVLKVHEPALLMHQIGIPDEADWSTPHQPNPTMSALRSALIPGLGQIYNGELPKGLIIFGANILLGLAQLRLVGNALFGAYHRQELTTLTQFLHIVFSSSHIVMTLLLTGIWIYAIGDAAMVARNKKMQQPTS